MKFWTLKLILLFGLEAALLGQPAIIKQPGNLTASLFADATFSLLVSGDLPLSYQWRFNNAELLGATNRILIVTNVQRSNAGDYNVIVSNPAGSITSQVATLTIVPFNSLYFFGFSWTDTHNCAQGWTSPDYYNGRASNGPLFPEYLSTNLGLAYVEPNNYARCRATALDVLNQVNSYSAPAKPQLSLYFLWAGDSDFLRVYPPDGGGLGYLPVTNEVAWTQLIQTLISRNSNAVNRLYTKGARAIVFQTQTCTNFFDVALFGVDHARLYNEYIARFNAGFVDAMNMYSRTRTDLRIISVDVFRKLTDVLVSPSENGFTKTDTDALGDTSLTNKSFTGPGADYVFWDAGHGTTKLNELIAGWHLEALTNSILETLEVTLTGPSPSIHMNHLQIGRDYTLQKSADLRNWSDIQTFTAAAGTNQWSVTSGVSGASYFRLKSPSRPMVFPGPTPTGNSGRWHPPRLAAAPCHIGCTRPGSSCSDYG